MPRASSRSSARASRSSAAASSSAAAELPVGGRLGSCERAMPRASDEVDQPLLGAVVQVALDPAALGVAELHDAGAGGADFLELGADLGLQALVLDRQAGGGRDRLHQLGLVVEGGVVDQGGGGVAVVAQDGDAAVAAGSWQLDRASGRVDEAPAGRAASRRAAPSGSWRARASACSSRPGEEAWSSSIARSPTADRSRRPRANPVRNPSGHSIRVVTTTRSSPVTSGWFGTTVSSACPDHVGDNEQRRDQRDRGETAPARPGRLAPADRHDPQQHRAQRHVGEVGDQQDCVGVGRAVRR